MEIVFYYWYLLWEFNEQRQYGVLCDVCVVVEGKVFKVYKNVLLGSSCYFKIFYCQVQKMLEQVMVMYLDIVMVQGFKVIIDFMYFVYLVFISRNVIEVMLVVSFLQMMDIVQVCYDFIKVVLDISIKLDVLDEFVEFEIGVLFSSSMEVFILVVMVGRSIFLWLVW